MIHEALAKRAEENNPIRVGIIGAGKFGAALVTQIAQMRGMVVSLLADVALESARTAFTDNHWSADDLVTVGSLPEAEEAFRKNRPAITGDGMLVCRGSDHP